ncbi:MAG: hypothetical protein WCC10_10305 [Tumebacillaceae bacterium]
MFSLLRGLLFQPQKTITEVVEQRRIEQASRLGFTLIVLMMINTAFFVGSYPILNQTMGENGKWLFVLLLPPLQYVVQRFVFLFACRLGLRLFASSKLPKDPLVIREKRAEMRMLFPYTVFPMLILTLIGSFFSSTLIEDFFLLLGLVYSFLITAHGLRAIYQVSKAAALWGPFLVQFAIGLILSTLYIIFIMSQLQ